MPFALCRTTKLKGVLLKRVPRRATNFLKWRICPTTDKLEIPRKLVTFQMRRTLGTDLQNQGTIKDAQGASRHATINTTADVYMQEIPASVRAAINSRTRAVLAKQQEAFAKLGSVTCPNSKNWRVKALETIGSSGRTRIHLKTSIQGLTQHGRHSKDVEVPGSSR
jgi:hypothetical protein